MTSPKKLILFSSAFLAITFLISALLFYLDVLSKDDFKAFLLAGIITAFNTGLGIISIKSVINKPESVFIQRLFGGMVIRFFTTLIMVVLALLFLELKRISFIFSILFFYIFYLVVEIIYLNFRQN
ncbi:MAG: hypothetical protein A2058_03195 [Ignavibacteria bacterium GWA2_36_19]|nr:MAG: hypothetical protein A2058_03195 [Ignavibacteria bacterium GWA2_36_19]